MTPGSPVDRDQRVELPMLDARLGITIPPIVDADGQPMAATGGLPHGVSPDDVVLAGVELDCLPIDCPGARICGTREPSLRSVLPGSYVPRKGISLIEVPLVVDVEQRLRDITYIDGLDNEMRSVADHAIPDVADYLVRLGEGRAAGAATIALHRASMALSSANEQALRVKAAAVKPTGAVAVQDAGLVLVGRAMLDVVACLNAWAHEGTPTPSEVRRRIDKIKGVQAQAGQMIDAIAALASKRGTRGIGPAMLRIVATGRKLVTRIEREMVQSPGDAECLERLDVESTPSGTAVPSAHDLENRLAVCGSATALTKWPASCSNALKGFCKDAPVRQAWLAAFDTRLIYRLLLERRTVEAATLFPWLAARHGAFASSRSGAIGAYAQLLELARAIENASDLVRRVKHMPHGCRAQRLTVGLATSIYGDAVALGDAVEDVTAMGCAVIDGAISHATVSAMIDGQHFGKHHMLGALKFGGTAWDMVDAIADPVTYGSMLHAEGSKVLGTYTGRRFDEYPTYMGMNAIEVVLLALVSIFPKGGKRLDDHQKDVRKKLALVIPGGDDATILYQSTLRIARAIIACIDPSGDESAVLEERIRDDGGKPSTGQSARTLGCKWLALHRTHRQSRILQAIEDTIANPCPCPIAALNTAVSRLTGFGPVADMSVPEFWLILNPDIGLWNWVQLGCPAKDFDLPISPGHRDLIATKVADAHGHAALLYARIMPSLRAASVMALLAIAPSSFTLDHAFVQLRAGLRTKAADLIFQK